MPAAGTPTFALGEGEMEMGVGIHGEPGRRRVKLAPRGCNRRRDGGGDRWPICARLRERSVLLLVNGFGGTPLMELYLMVNAAHRVLEGRGLRVVRHLTGSFVTSLDMAGCSMTLSLFDEETVRLWDAPVRTAALSW